MLARNLRVARELNAVMRARGEDAEPDAALLPNPLTQREMDVLEWVARGKTNRDVAEILGIPREETIAIGDGENDISMLRWAGLGIAMANAPENVKAAADVIAPACDEDGAAWAMEKYLL